MDDNAAVPGELYHSTPYADGFPYDDWSHVGTRTAAEHRAAQIRPVDYGFPADHPVTMHTVRLRGQVYPHILTNEQADELWGAGHTHGLADDGLPAGEGYQVFPYQDDAGNGDLSYVVHRAAIVPIRLETIPRSELAPELAVTTIYFHGGPNRVEPGGLIHQDAMPKSHGRSRYNCFSSSREVAEDAADSRNGRGHGWIHVVQPTGPFEVDPAEPESWKSEAPLRVTSVEPGSRNGKTPHPPILRQADTAATDNAGRQPRDFPGNLADGVPTAIPHHGGASGQHSGPAPRRTP